MVVHKLYDIIGLTGVIHYVACEANAMIAKIHLDRKSLRVDDSDTPINQDYEQAMGE